MKVGVCERGNSGRKRKGSSWRVGRAGFEPAKVWTNRFTVCPRWPLEYLPFSSIFLYAEASVSGSSGRSGGKSKKILSVISGFSQCFQVFSAIFLQEKGRWGAAAWKSEFHTPFSIWIFRKQGWNITKSCGVESLRISMEGNCSYPLKNKFLTLDDSLLPNQ